MPEKDEILSNALPNISTGEFKLCLIIWEKGAISSGQLVKVCFKRYQWAKSTVYTYIRRLIHKGILENNHAVIRLMVSKEDIQLAKIEYLIQHIFEGSHETLISMLKQNINNIENKLP